MSLWISQDCINCDMCIPVCPNDAIIEGKKIYEIVESKCTECEGLYAEPQCQKACPIRCIFEESKKPKV